MEFIDVGRLLPDDNRTLPSTCAQNGRRRGGAIRQASQHTLNEYSKTRVTYVCKFFYENVTEQAF